MQAKRTRGKKAGGGGGVGAVKVEEPRWRLDLSAAALSEAV